MAFYYSMKNSDCAFDVEFVDSCCSDSELVESSSSDEIVDSISTLKRLTYIVKSSGRVYNASGSLT